MPVSVAQKLKIKEGFSLLVIHPPSTFETALGGKPPGLQVSETAATFQQIHWFVRDSIQLQKEVKSVVAKITGDVTCWIYFPKASSGVQTDLTRDKGWDSLLVHNQLQWINLVSFDATWSAFSVRLKKKTNQTKVSDSKRRVILDYVDPVRKLVTLPDDFASLLAKSETEAAFFQQLSFTNKKEYVEWIVTAK